METEIRGIVGVGSEIVIDQIGEEVVAVNVEIDQGLKHQNKKERTEKIIHAGCRNS